MRRNYEEFALRYEKSGMSKRAFGEQEGLSPSMVSYYLKRAAVQVKTSSNFKEIEIIPTQVPSNFLKITTTSGVVIEIPL